MPRPLGNIYHKKKTYIGTSSSTSPLRIVTINLPEEVLCKIDRQLVQRLYASRSEAVRRYTLMGVQKDLEMIALLDNTFEVGKEYYPENENEFTDQWGKTWNYGRAIENA